MKEAYSTKGGIERMLKISHSLSSPIQGLGKGGREQGGLKQSYKEPQ